MALQQKIEENLRHNYIANFFGVTFYLVAISFRAEHTILPLFISKLTDSPVAIGVLSSIVSTGSLVPQLFAANWVQRTPIKKFISVNIGFFTERLPLICLILAPWLATWSKTAALFFGMFCITWYVVGSGITMVAWQDMIAKIIPSQTRGRLMGTTFFIGTGAGVIGSIVASRVLENYLFPTNFMITFGLAALFIVISWVFLAITKEPPDPPKITNSNKNKVVDWTQIAQVFNEDSNYRKYLVSAVINALGLMAVGFLAVYTLDKWQVSDSQVALYTTFLLGGQAVGYLMYGWLADRIGNKLSLEINSLVSVASMVFAIMAQDQTIFYLVFALRGVYASGSFLSGMNINFDFSKPEIRPTYIGLSNTVIGIFSGVAPLIGGVLAGWLDYTWMFAIAASLSLLGYLVLKFWVVEPRKTAKLT